MTEPVHYEARWLIDSQPWRLSDRECLLYLGVADTQGYAGQRSFHVRVPGGREGVLVRGGPWGSTGPTGPSRREYHNMVRFPDGVQQVYDLPLSDTALPPLANRMLQLVHLVETGYYEADAAQSLAPEEYAAGMQFVVNLIKQDIRREERMEQT